MEEKQKIDLQKYQLRRFSKWQLARIIFYIIAIAGIIVYLSYIINQKSDPTTGNTTIKTIEIEF